MLCNDAGDLVTSGGNGVPRRSGGRCYRPKPAIAGSLVAGLVALCVSADVRPHQRVKPASNGALTSLWPAARVDTVLSPAYGGDAYRPLMFLDTRMSFGVDAAVDGSEVRLQLVRGDRQDPLVLRTFPMSVAPSIDAVAHTAGRVVWTEGTTDAAGVIHTQLWQADWRSGTSPRLIVADMGSVVTARSRYDLQIVGARAVWLARTDAATPVTELRSVNLDGTSASAQPLAGQFESAKWPWVLDSSGSQANRYISSTPRRPSPPS